MRNLPTFVVSLITLSTLNAAAALPGINIIQNGDFEILGDHDFPPWQFYNGFNAFVFEPAKVASGGNCIFVAGLMWQDLNTEIGQAYQLSYYERGDDPGQSERYSVLNVYWGDQQVASHVEFNLTQGWHQAQFSVVATSPTTRLTFEQASGTVGSYGYPGVDLVRVVTMIPEPSTLGVCAAALGVVFTLARSSTGRRRRC